MQAVVSHLSIPPHRQGTGTRRVSDVLRAAWLPSPFLACGQSCVVAHQAAVALVRSLVRHGGAAEVLKSALGSVTSGVGCSIRQVSHTIHGLSLLHTPPTMTTAYPTMTTAYPTMTTAYATMTITGTQP